MIADYQWKRHPSFSRWATLPVAAMFVAACLFLLSPYYGILRSSFENNYRQTLGVAPSRVEASVSTQENTSVAIGVPREAKTPELLAATAKDPEPFSPPPEVPEASSETGMIILPIKMKPQSADRAPETPEAQFPVVRAMKDGQTLFQLTREVYGRSDPRLIEWVVENNPWISDVTKIPNGKEIIFPEPPERR